MSVEENKALVRQSTADFNARRWERYYARIAPDYRVHGLPPGLSSSREVIRQLQQALLTAFPDLQFTHDDEFGEGDWVVTRETATGTHQGAYLGIAPTGKRVAWSRIGIDRIAAGTFVESWGANDTLRLLQQLGAVPGAAPAPPQAEGVPTSEQRLPPSVGPAPTSPEANKALIRRLLDELWHRRNVAIVDELFAEDFTSHVSPPGTPPGRESVRQIVQRTLQAAQDWHITIEEMVAEGDKVAYHFTMSGTQTGTFLGVAPTGKPITFTGIEIDRLTAGRLVEQWATEDVLGLLQQLGAAPVFGTADRPADPGPASVPEPLT